MRVFWEKGYEGTTLGDPTKAMGMNRSSLNSSFGDKEILFRLVNCPICRRTIGVSHKGAQKSGLHGRSSRRFCQL
jgi:hypothetical protein